MFTLSHLTFGKAFTGMENHEYWFELMPNYIYFSFVTLTTLGYGEITPTLPITRFLVYSEAIIGQFYMAILVASLVGTHLSENQNKQVSERQ